MDARILQMVNIYGEIRNFWCLWRRCGHVVNADKVSYIVYIPIDRYDRYDRDREPTFSQLQMIRLFTWVLSDFGSFLLVNAK